MLPYIVSVLLVFVVPSHSVSRPPGIIDNPPRNVYYKPLDSVMLPCNAEGSPEPSYTWKRDGVLFNPSGRDMSVVQLPNSGTLVFNSPEKKDEGFYQCFAKNDFGTSVSINTNFRAAVLDEFDPNVPDKTYEARQGFPLSLKCTPPESIPNAAVYWIIKHEFGWDPVNYDSRISMDKEFSLNFAYVKKEDEQNGNAYACQAANSKMRANVHSHLHYIKVTGGETFQPTGVIWADEFDLSGIQGQNFTIQCIFSGNPIPVIKWERKGNKTLPSRAKLLGFAQTLMIENLQPEDAGSYTCWATNPMSGGRRETRSFDVRVNSVPYFIQEPQDVEIGIGGNVEFSCVAGGNPEPRIEWRINGLELSSSLMTIPYTRPVPTKLFFENVTESSHMVIQCNATNKYGYAFADVYLNVLSEAPEMIVPPQPYIVSAEGLDVNLTCKTTGKPDPIITWYKDGGQVSGGRFQILTDGTLNILSAVLADASHYRCEAVNKYGRDAGEGVLVIRRKTRIEQKPGDLERNAGMDAKFTCSGTTDPEEVQNLRVYWLKDGEEILANDQRTTTNYQDNSLTISGTIVRDSGTYTCVATNGLDKATASAVLTVRDKPDPATNVFHKDCDKKNVTIVWMPGSFNNAPLQYYILQYNTSFNPDQWHFAMKLNGSWSEVDFKLTPWVQYSFRLIAYNKIGPSSPSSITKKVCTADPAKPSAQPANLRTLGHEKGRLYMEWTPVPETQQNAPGFRYKLKWRRVGDNQNSDWDSITISNWTRNWHSVKVGYVYTPYNITIKALNSKGDAEQNPTNITGYSFEDLPEIKPYNFEVKEVGDTHALFTWDFDRSEIDVIGTRIRGKFMGFKIYFWQKGYRMDTVRVFDIGPESAKNLTGNTFSAVVENMIPNTNMEAQISVKNNFYSGRPSDIIRFKTEPGFPGPVDFFRVINIGDTHVNLEWISPTENRGDLEGYDISYQLVNGLELGEMQEREPQINDPYTTNGYLSGLQPRRKYRVYIFARTLKGRGEGYFIELVTKKPITPNIPDFTIPNIGETFINVSWWVDAYKSSGSVVYVEYRQLDGAEWLRTSDEVVNTWQTISNLESGTKYEIRIKATNGAVSIPSSIEEVETRGNAMAYDLVENIGWFLGILFSLLLLIGNIVIYVVCWKRGFRFQRSSPSDQNYNSSMAYSDTAEINKVPDPKGYNNDYYDDKDHYYDDDNGRPPSFSSTMDGKNRRYSPTAPDEYEEYGGYGRRDYDDCRDNQDNYDQPQDRYNDYGRDGYYDQDYGYDNRDYDGYNYDDRRNDAYQRRPSGNRDDQGYDYDSEETGQNHASKGNAASSTFV